MTNAKIYAFLGIVFLFVCFGFSPLFIFTIDAEPTRLSAAEEQTVKQEVDRHFDQPLQRILVLQYDVYDQEEPMIVVGRTVFGIPMVRAAVYADGEIETIENI